MLITSLLALASLAAEPGEALPPPPPPEQLVPTPITCEQPPVPRLGDRGQIVVAGTTGTTDADSQASTHTGVISLAGTVSVDYFVWRSLSVGAQLTVGFSESSLTKSTSNTWTFSGGPRLGYVIPVSDRILLWPTASFSAVHSSGSSSIPGSVSLVNDTYAGRLALPVLIALVPRVAWGLGPYGSYLYNPGSPSSGSTLLGGPSHTWAVGVATQLGVTF